MEHAVATASEQSLVRILYIEPVKKSLLGLLNQDPSATTFRPTGKAGPAFRPPLPKGVVRFLSKVFP
jgi:hypothetical protein